MSVIFIIEWVLVLRWIITFEIGCLMKTLNNKFPWILPTKNSTRYHSYSIKIQIQNCVGCRKKTSDSRLTCKLIKSPPFKLMECTRIKFKNVKRRWWWWWWLRWRRWHAIAWKSLDILAKHLKSTYKLDKHSTAVPFYFILSECFDDHEKCEPLSELIVRLSFIRFLSLRLIYFIVKISKCRHFAENVCVETWMLKWVE